MTEEKALLIGRSIGTVINLGVDIYIGSAIGHQFHSFALGFLAYAVLASLDSINLKLRSK